MWWMAMACGAGPVEGAAPVEVVAPPVGEPASGGHAVTDPPPSGATDPQAAAFAADPHPPLPLADPSVGRLDVVGGDPVRVTWTLPGSNGCYRQGPVTLTLGEDAAILSYTTRREGEVCSMALVPGGFSGSLVGVPVGWTVRVVVDGVARGQAVVPAAPIR